MLKRIAIMMALGLAVVPLALATARASATIDGAFHGAFAEAAWQTSPTSLGWSLTSREQNGTTHLSVHQLSDVTLDAEGNIIGGTELAGETTIGVSFMVDTIHFSGAAVQGVIPMHVCTIVDGIEANCGTDGSAGSMSFEAHWTGIGPIPHFPSTDLSWQDGCLQVDRNSSVEREAVLEVTTLRLNGTPIAATPAGFAGFGKGNSRIVVMCTGA